MLSGYSFHEDNYGGDMLGHLPFHFIKRVSVSTFCHPVLGPSDSGLRQDDWRFGTMEWTPDLNHLSLDGPRTPLVTPCLGMIEGQLWCVSKELKVYEG